MTVTLYKCHDVSNDWQLFVQANSKANIKGSHCKLCAEKPSVACGISAQRTGNMERVSISWCCHAQTENVSLQTASVVIQYKHVIMWSTPAHTMAWYGISRQLYLYINQYQRRLALSNTFATCNNSTCYNTTSIFFICSWTNWQITTIIQAC